MTICARWIYWKKPWIEKLFLVKFKKGSTHLGVQLSDKALELLDNIDFSKPDPANGIAPHIIILSDGLRVNHGRVARITVNKPFNPFAANILYQDSFLMDEFLMRERRLSKESIAVCSKALLGEVLGKSQSPYTRSRLE